MSDNYFYKCNYCNNMIDVRFSSAGINELKRHGWDYEFVEIIHTIPEKIWKKDGRYVTIPEKVKNEFTINITCKDCIISINRKNKLNKILGCK
ncbi:MAG: hypothetical protein ACOC3V_01490 [bacterium]